MTTLRPSAPLLPVGRALTGSNGGCEVKYPRSIARLARRRTKAHRCGPRIPSGRFRRQVRREINSGESMQMAGRNPIQPKAGTASKSLVLVLVTAAIALLQGCGGTSNPNYPASTALNPAPGVTLQKIQIIPATPIILLAESRQLGATGVYSDGSSIDITSQGRW